MQIKNWLRCSFILAAVLAFSAGCGKETGTFVKFTFDGTVRTDLSIQSIEVISSFDSRVATTTFPARSATGIALPTSAVLEIGSGAGRIDVSARALAGDGTVLGTGTGSGTVVRDKTTIIAVLFMIGVADAGVDSAVLADDALPVDTGALDISADRASDVPGIETGGGDRGGAIGTDVQGTGGTLGADAGDATLDLPIGIDGAGGLGGSGGVAGTGGAGGTGGGGADANDAPPMADASGYQLTVSPPALDFGAVAVGATSSPQALTIINTGGGPTAALTVYVGDTRHFPLYQDGCTGAVLNPGGSCVLFLTFFPESAGPLQSVGSVGPVNGLAAKFTLSGRGASGIPVLTLTPATADFGIVDVPTSVSREITLTSSGTGSSGNIQIVLDGPTAFAITSDRCTGTALTGSAQCTFTLTFTPTSAGSMTAKLTAQSLSGATTTSGAKGIGRDYVQLTIQFPGKGGGTVNGITPACPSPGPCSVSFARSDTFATADLTATPNALSVFGDWSGDCTGTTATCSVLMNAAKTVIATFNPRRVPLSLTVLTIGPSTTGGGTLYSPDDSSISCTGSCPDLSADANPSFRLRARPASGSYFLGWSSGPCKGTVPECTFDLTAPVSVTATFGPAAFMFVTSIMVESLNLGGIGKGDELCQSLAVKANLPGTYVAWLSTKGTNARDRVGQGGWMRTDGRPFARDLTSLADGLNPVVFYPPRLDETGKDLGNKPILVATGGTIDGTNPGESQCGDYGSTLGDLYVGDASDGSYGWNYTQKLKGGCATRMRLYCFQSDGPVTQNLPPKPEVRRIFITKNPFRIGGSMTPDQMCQNEAKPAGLPFESFFAFIATADTAALSRFDLSGPPWMRPDNVLVTQKATDLGEGITLAPINVAADGKTYVSGNVWTGAENPNLKGTATCKDWTDSSLAAGALVGESRTTASWNWFKMPATVPCADPNTRLMCAEK